MTDIFSSNAPWLKSIISLICTELPIVHISKHIKVSKQLYLVVIKMTPKNFLPAVVIYSKYDFFEMRPTFLDDPCINYEV